MYDIPCCVLPMVCLKPSKRCRGPFFPVSAFHFLHQRIIVAESTANSVGPRQPKTAATIKSLSHPPATTTTTTSRGREDLSHMWGVFYNAGRHWIIFTIITLLCSAELCSLSARSWLQHPWKPLPGQRRWQEGAECFPLLCS